jgi:hypothetical protein
MRFCQQDGAVGLVRQGGLHSTNGGGTNYAHVPVQEQENCHSAVQDLCATTPRVCYTRLVPWQQVDKDIVEKVQHRAVGMVSGLKSQVYEDRLKELGMFTLEDRAGRHGTDVQNNDRKGDCGT